MAVSTTGVRGADTNNTGKALEEVRAALDPGIEILGEARSRRGLVLDAALTFKGVNRKYYSGSIAHGTANADLDADCGIVLDRRTHPELGPDGDGSGPEIVVQRVRELVSEALGASVEVETSKRAITVRFHDPHGDFDPSVDLIVGLERRELPGLWIPNLLEGRWDPSHPERHTTLFTSGGRRLRRVRARAIRLAKGWNGQYEPPALSSFNLEALAWMCVTEEMSEPEALAALFAFGAHDLERRSTPDPADVSPAIKLLVDRDTAVRRLRSAADLMRTALDHDDDESVIRDALARLFWKYLTPPAESTSVAAWAATLRGGNSGVTMGSSGLSLGAEGERIKETRSWADEW
jgi:hypothetical protein